MQAYSHFLWAIFMAQLMNDYNKYIVALSIFFSHYIIDAFAIITYHPPGITLINIVNAIRYCTLHKLTHREAFWLSYHIFVIIFTIMIFIKYVYYYGWFMISSILVDLYDWVLIRCISLIYHNNNQAQAHKPVGIIRHYVLWWLPNWTYIEYTVWIEMTLACLLLMYIN